MNICNEHDRNVAYIAEQKKKLYNDVSGLIDECNSLFDILWQMVAEATANTGSAISMPDSFGISGMKTMIQDTMQLAMKTDHNIGEDYLHNSIEQQKRKLNSIKTKLGRR